MSVSSGVGNPVCRSHVDAENKKVDLSASYMSIAPYAYIGNPNLQTWDCN